MIPLLFAAMYLIVFFTALVPIQEPDFWWHLASGRFMIAQDGVARTDPFSWTAHGTPWVDSYWAYDVLAAWAHRGIGVTGLVVLHAVFVLAVFYLLDQRMIRQSTAWSPRLGMMTAMLLGGAPAGGYWGPEASVVTLLFFSLLTAQGESLRRTGWQKSLWLWPLGFMLWANLHRGFVLGLVMAALWAAEEALRSRRWARNASWFLACAAAVFITPYSWHLLGMIRDDLTLSSQWVMGWDEARMARVPFFYLAVALFDWLLIRHWRSQSKSQLATWTGGTLLAIGGIRHLVYIPYFMVLTLPWIVERMTPAGNSVRRAAQSWFGRWEIPLTAILFAYLLFARFPRSLQFDGSRSDVFPFIQKEAIEGPFYNDYNFGGYWIWFFNGQPPVFVDGRYPAVEGYKTVVQDMVQGQKSAGEWRKFLQRYPVSAALVKYREGGPLPSMFQAMFRRDEWALVYWDDANALFLRRGKNERLIARQEFLQVWPDLAKAAFIEQVRRSTAAERENLARDLERSCALHPASRRARMMRDVFLQHHLESSRK